MSSAEGQKGRAAKIAALVLIGALTLAVLAASGSAVADERHVDEVVLDLADVRLNGTVVNAGSGTPHAGLIVKLDGSNVTTTNASGGFEFMTTPGNHTIAITGAGVERVDQRVLVGQQGTDLGNISVSPTTDWTPIIFIAIVFLLAIFLLVVWQGRRRIKQ